MKLNLLTAAVLVFSGFADAASFQGHSTFTAQPIRGYLNITCNEGGRIDSRQVICEDIYLAPFEYGYFDAEKGLGADEVLITSQRADGKTIEKKSAYNSEIGRSEKRINLWISTLLQTPILDIGNNVVSYRLMSGGEVKASGQFDVTVDVAPQKQCPNGYEQSFTLNDCMFPNNNLCDRYFRRYNYCD